MVETLKVFLRNRKAAFGLLIVLAYVAVAIFGPMILGADPMARVGRPHMSPDGEALMGTTRMGRDVFSQLVYGTRTSLAVGRSSISAPMSSSSSPSFRCCWSSRPSWARPRRSSSPSSSG